MTQTINLNDLVCKTFRQVFIDIVNCNVNEAILDGGRGSTKSAVVSEAIIVGCMKYKQPAICLLNYNSKIETRLVNTFAKSMSFLGVEEFWDLKRSPFEYFLLDENGKRTNVSIKFFGCDSPKDLKGAAPKTGSFRYIWFEELDTFKNYEQIQNVIDTVGRGKGKHCTVMTYNPPLKNSNWVNKKYNLPIGKALGYDSNYHYDEFEFKIDDEITEKTTRVVHHSTYLDVISDGHYDWLDISWIGRARQSEKENNIFYRWNYLGEVIGGQSNVFWNIKDWDGDINQFNIREVLRGFDWGNGGPDPCAYVEWYYDRANHRLYALNEFYKPKMEPVEVAEKIRSLNKHNFPVWGDSAVPTLNKLVRKEGINLFDVKKPRDSTKAGIKWLQSLNGIYINKYKTPNIYREFTEYEYEIDKEDNITDILPDKNNHTIDATRYAAVNEIKYN